MKVPFPKLFRRSVSVPPVDQYLNSLITPLTKRTECMPRSCWFKYFSCMLWTALGNVLKPGHAGGKSYRKYTLFHAQESILCCVSYRENCSLILSSSKVSLLPRIVVYQVSGRSLSHVIVGKSHQMSFCKEQRQQGQMLLF